MLKRSKEAENQFIGVNCGIMDQFAIGMGKKDCAILLDTNTLKYQYANIELNGASIVIANTNKRRGLLILNIMKEEQNVKLLLKIYKLSLI